MNNNTNTTNTTTSLDIINALVENNPKFKDCITDRKAWEENNSKPNSFVVDFVSDEGKLIDKDFEVWVYDDSAWSTIFEALKNKGLNMDDITWNPNSAKIEVISQREVVEGEEEYYEGRKGDIWKGQAKITRCPVPDHYPLCEEINEAIERVRGIAKYFIDNKLDEKGFDTFEKVAEVYPDAKFYLDEGFMVNDFKCTHDDCIVMTSCIGDAEVKIYLDSFGCDCEVRYMLFGLKK